MRWLTCCPLYHHLVISSFTASCSAGFYSLVGLCPLLVLMRPYPGAFHRSLVFSSSCAAFARPCQLLHLSLVNSFSVGVPIQRSAYSSSSDVTDILRSPSVAVSRVSLNSLGPPRYFWQVVSAFPQRDVSKVEQHGYCRPALAPRRRLRIRLIGCCTEKRQPVPGYHSSHPSSAKLPVILVWPHYNDP